MSEAAAGRGCMGRDIRGRRSSVNGRWRISRSIVFPLCAALLIGLVIWPVSGVITITESAQGVYQIGEPVTFSGLNTENTTTYLFMIGPYLDERGTMLSNTSRLARDGHLDSTGVGSDWTWSFSWDTSGPGVALYEGVYLIYAVDRPADKSNVVGKNHDTRTIEFRGRFLPVTTPPTETPTPVPTWTRPPAGSDVRVSFDPTNDAPGKFDGLILAYEAVRGTGDSDIYLYDIATGNTTAIATGPAIQRTPAVSGDMVVYTAYTKKGWEQTDTDLYLYRISTGETTRITLPGEQVNPRISGNLLAWQDEPPGHSSVNLMLQDLSTGAQMKVPTRMWAYSPDISGDQVIWIDNPAGPAVYLYDLTGDTWQRVTNRTGIQGQPVLDRGRIAWADSRGDDIDIFVLDLATGVETQVTEGDGNQFTPSLSGDRVVWIDFRNRNHDVYTYDLATGRTTEVTTNPAEQENVQIGGCIVAWSDDRNGSYDVYYQELSGCTPPPAIGMVSLPEETPVATETPVTTRTTVPTTVATPPETPVPTTQSPGFPAALAPAGIGAALLAWRRSKGSP